ncbi:MAG: hypothetical protein LAP21_09175 [Acidobacteriia bacterium]|nr:hypothetical protein [Terriglobia bacterium]
MSLAFALSAAAVAQDDPALKSRPHDSAAPAAPQTAVYNPGTAVAGPPNAIPEGTRFIIKLRDTIDTGSRDLEPGKRFKAELSEDLVTPSGLIIPRGRTVKGHVGSFEHGYVSARLLLALDEIETRKGWVPLIGIVTGVPGDPSIKSTENEGEITRKGPDVKRAVTNAAVGAAVGAVSGAVAAGGKGAAIGAAVGAGLGTGSGLLSKKEIKLNKDTLLEVRLDRDLTVPTR